MPKICGANKGDFPYPTSPRRVSGVLCRSEVSCSLLSFSHTCCLILGKDLADLRHQISCARASWHTATIVIKNGLVGANYTATNGRG